jgi:serine phosphatase RsbU (regulator of sigma subunit)
VFEDWLYEQEEVQLRSGDRLLMYTDGITESRNSAGEEFGGDRAALSSQEGNARAPFSAADFAVRHAPRRGLRA